MARWLAANAIAGSGFRVFSQVLGEDGPDRHRLAVNLPAVLDTRTTVGRAYFGHRDQPGARTAPGLGSSTAT